MNFPDRDYAREFLSSIGIFAPWYLRDSQLDIYELLVECQEPFIEASRRFGKTTSIAVFVHELLNANPGWIWRWCAPDQKQARQIVKPIFSQIQNMTPEENRAKWLTTDSHYRYPNGSILYLVGVNQDKGESARGPAANGITLDEYGFWVEAEYIAKSILFPQLQNQAGQYFIKASTPPPDLDHVYYREKKLAIRKGKFIQKLIWDNEALSKTELDKIIEEAGGVDSVTFRREYLCEEVSDPKKLVIPEWSEAENVIDDDYPYPECYDTYVSIDSGADDNTACEFGYYDFHRNEIIVDYEFFINGETTKTIISLCKVIEVWLWGTPSHTLDFEETIKKILDKKSTEAQKTELDKEITLYYESASKRPYKRVYDGDKQLIYDVIGDHEYKVQLPLKQDKIASIHELRTEVSSRRFKVKRRCKNLIYQMKVGMWANDKHLDFQRSESLGHLDGVAAAMYLQRSVDRSRNPYPLNYGYNYQTHLINQPGSSPLGQNAKALKSAFFPKRGLK